MNLPPLNEQALEAAYESANGRHVMGLLAVQAAVLAALPAPMPVALDAEALGRIVSDTIGCAHFEKGARDAGLAVANAIARALESEACCIAGEDAIGRAACDLDLRWPQVIRAALGAMRLEIEPVERVDVGDAMRIAYELTKCQICDEGVLFGKLLHVLEGKAVAERAPTDDTALRAEVERLRDELAEANALLDAERLISRRTEEAHEAGRAEGIAAERARLLRPENVTRGACEAFVADNLRGGQEAAIRAFERGLYAAIAHDLDAAPSEMPPYEAAPDALGWNVIEYAPEGPVTLSAPQRADIKRELDDAREARASRAELAAIRSRTLGEWTVEEIDTAVRGRPLCDWGSAMADGLRLRLARHVEAVTLERVRVGLESEGACFAAREGWASAVGENNAIMREGIRAAWRVAVEKTSGPASDKAEEKETTSVPGSVPEQAQVGTVAPRSPAHAAGNLRASSASTDDRAPWDKVNKITGKPVDPPKLTFDDVRPGQVWRLQCEGMTVIEGSADTWEMRDAKGEIRYMTADGFSRGLWTLISDAPAPTATDSGSLDVPILNGLPYATRAEVESLREEIAASLDGLAKRAAALESPTELPPRPDLTVWDDETAQWFVESLQRLAKGRAK